MNIEDYGKMAEAIGVISNCIDNGCTIRNLEENIDGSHFKIPVQTTFNPTSITKGLNSIKAQLEAVPETKDEAEEKKIEAVLQMVTSKFGLSSADEIDYCIRHLINNEETIDKIAAMINQQHPGSIKDNEALFNYFIELMTYIGQEQSNANVIFQNFKVLQSENANLKARVQSLETQIGILTK